VGKSSATSAGANSHQAQTRQAKKRRAQQERQAAAELAQRQRQRKRTVTLIRAGVLLAVGVVIAFTATMHENLEANRWMFAGAFVLLGVATLIEYIAKRSERSAWTIAVRAALTVLAAVAVLLSPDQGSVAYVIAGWAILNGLLVLLPGIRSAEARKPLLPAAFLSLALAVLILMNHSDSVAVIGFFGAYAVISGVFLGISAFDNREGQPDAQGQRRTSPSPGKGDR